MFILLFRPVFVIIISVVELCAVASIGSAPRRCCNYHSDIVTEIFPVQNDVLFCLRACYNVED